MTTALNPGDVVSLLNSLSNWGKWGIDDQLGTLNYITPKKVAEAAASVLSGRVVSIAHDMIITSPAAPDERPAGLHSYVSPAKLRVFRTQSGDTFSDELTIPGHGYAMTHIDALAHCTYDEHIYNGVPVAEAITDKGVQVGDVAAMRDGVVTRGVLLDITKVRGSDPLDSTDTVTMHDLEEAEKLSGTTVESGDAVFVRVGVGLRVKTQNDIDFRLGLSPDCAIWLNDREVSLFGSDCPEKIPSGYEPAFRIPFHQAVMVRLGLALLDNVAMEPMAAACAEEGRNHFMFTMAPLRIPHATCSAVNPLILF
jgi:kynurenine formamidase